MKIHSAFYGVLGFVGFGAVLVGYPMYRDQQYLNSRADYTCYSLFRHEWEDPQGNHMMVQKAKADGVITNRECRDYLSYREAQDYAAARAREDAILNSIGADSTANRVDVK